AEDRRHSVARTAEGGLSIRSFTSRRGAYRENPNQSVVLEVEGDRETAFMLTLSEPAQQTTRTTVADMLAGSVNLATGPFPKESYQWHRIVPLAASSLRDRQVLRVPEGR